MADQLTAKLQLGVLALLLFSNEYAKRVRQTVGLDVWIGEEVRALTERVYFYIDTHQMPPKENTVDLIGELKLNKDQQYILMRMVSDVSERFANMSNQKHIVNQLQDFHRQSTLKQAFYTGSKLLEMGRADEAEAEMLKALKNRYEAFSSGSTLDNVIDRLRVKEGGVDLNDVIFWDIPALDRARAFARRGKLTILCAPPKSGKTWGAVHLGKQAAYVENKKVLHVSCEMDEDEVGARYLQSLFALKEDESDLEQWMSYIRDNREIMMYKGVTTRPVLHESLDYAHDLAATTNLFKNLRIVSRPSGSMTTHELEAILDNLELQEGFIPDVVIIDYPDIMQWSQFHKEKRHALNALYVWLRGFAEKRNVFMICPTQPNRPGAMKPRIEGEDLGEDYGKVQTCDLLVTWQRTDLERKAGLVRLYVAASRKSRDKFEVLVFQNLEIGQFALDSREFEETWAKRLDGAFVQFGLKDAQEAKAS